jgi:hypothetical protein
MAARRGGGAPSHGRAPDRPEQPGGGPRGSLDAGRDGGVAAVYNALAAHSIAMQRRLLPIYEYRTALLYALEMYGVVVVVGETGCGKSTREWPCGPGRAEGDSALSERRLAG